MFIILTWLAFVVLFVAVFAAHIIVERLMPRESMAKPLKPARVPSPAVDARSTATPSTARPGPAPMVGPSTEIPRARPSLQPPTKTEAPGATGKSRVSQGSMIPTRFTRH